MTPEDLGLFENPQGPYIFPYAMQGGQLVAYNPGTCALADTDWSELHYWRCWATQDGKVYLGCDTFPEVLFWEYEDGIRWIRFTFDQNMNPVLLFKPMLGNSLIVRYFHPGFQQFMLKSLPTGTISAAIVLDDVELIEESNIFVFYTLSNKLYCYTQADLYDVATEVYPDVEGQIILAAGMMPGRRLQLLFGFNPWEGGTPEVPDRIPRGSMGHVKDPKLADEILPVKISMLDRCIDGEEIATAVVVCSVLSGADDNPAALLDGTASIKNGDWVTQNVVGGVVGVVYTLWFVARSTLNNIYIDTVNLAILPSSLVVYTDIRITDAGDVRGLDSGDRRVVDQV